MTQTVYNHQETEDYLNIKYCNSYFYIDRELLTDIKTTYKNVIYRKCQI